MEKNIVKILLITHTNPFPPISGGKIRLWSIATDLKNRFDCDIRIACPGKNDTKVVVDGITIYEIKAPHRHRFFNLAKTIFTGIPELIYTSNYKHFENKIREIYDEFWPDIVQCEHIWPALTVLKINSKLRYIVAHNVEWKIYERKFQTAKNPIYKIIYCYIYNRFKSFETKTLKKFDKVFCVSVIDMQLLTKMGLSNSEVIENGVDIEYYSKKINSKINQNIYRLIFIGALNYKANIDSVQFIIEKIYPEIIRKCQNIEFTIVGSNPPEWLNKIKKPNLKIYTDVPDVRQYLNDADVYICPILYGSGSRLKILEAFASRIPVVSTSIGAEGLEVINGENILLADDVESFVNKILVLLRDIPLREKLISNAFKLVNEKYSWHLITEKLYNLYKTDYYADK